MIDYKFENQNIPPEELEHQTSLYSNLYHLKVYILLEKLRGMTLKDLDRNVLQKMKSKDNDKKFQLVWKVFKKCLKIQVFLWIGCD